MKQDNRAAAKKKVKKRFRENIKIDDSERTHAIPGR